MRAVVQDRYGGAEQLRVSEVADPVPGRGEVLVRVQAAGVDRGTWHLMVGLPLMIRPVLGLRGPRQPIPGRDLAGAVVALGPGVTEVAVGDLVLGTADGSFAQLAVVPVSRLARRPDGLEPVAAAALPVSGLTALHALDAAGVGAGDRVLVIGASGGVGTYAVQLAAARGARVTGVCGTAKADLVRGLGATEVIDHTTEQVDARGVGYDAILDIGGNRPVSVLRRVLAERGTLVLVGGEGGGRWLGGMQRQVLAALRSPFTRQRLVMLVSRERGDDMARLAEMAAVGTIRPAVERTYPLERAGEAIEHVGAGRARGKVVVVVDPTLAG